MGEIIHEKQDLRFLKWDRIRNSSGTAGSFLKAYSEDENEEKIYYKLSNYDSINNTICGHECVNEIIVDRLLTLLGIEHLSYTLINAAILLNEKEIDTYLCASKNFRKREEDKTPLDIFYDLEHFQGETPYQFCLRQGWREYVSRMLLVDYLILNRDRHGANIEILRNKKNKSIRLAPLFDQGLSLLAPCRNEEAIEKFSVMEDRQVQCFVGTGSALENLDLIEKEDIIELNQIKESDREILLQGLSGVISEKLADKIWDMIWNRWQLIYHRFFL